MQKRKPFEAQLTQLSLAASFPLLLLLLWVMIYAGISIFLVLLVTLLGGLIIAYSNYQIYQKSAYQFRSLSNLLEAMVYGDYSLRARGDDSEGALNELVNAINGLADRLSQQRIESVESQFLLRTVIDHIDVAIVALDQQDHIHFTNPAARKLLHLDNSSQAERLNQLAFLSTISRGEHQVIELSLGSQQGRFNVHVEQYRSSGQQHKILFITDVRTLLRSEERKAWQSLVRVISHEINNSLTPIASLSQTLTRLVQRQPIEDTAREDLSQGLNLIGERAKGLSQFINSYQQLSRLPPPNKKAISCARLIEKVAALFNSDLVTVDIAPELELCVDPVQFEQVLINLLKNAEEAMKSSTSGDKISIEITLGDLFVLIKICDAGCGIGNSENLFVPFYSTKPHGSGIGLVLSRQIVEAHGGRLTLNNREDTQGCCAMIEIPVTL